MKTASTTILFLIFCITATAAVHPNLPHKAAGGQRSLTEFLDSSKVWTWNSATSAYDQQQTGVFYTYDPQNYVTVESSRRWTAGAWVDEHHVSYSYDTRHNEIGALHQYWSSGTWVTNDEGIYTYDAHNNITSAIERGLSAGIYDTTDISTWTYDASETLVEYSYAYTVYVPSYDHREVWQLNGDQYHPLSITWQEWINGNAWANTTKNNYKYGQQGSLDTIITQRWYNGAWADSARKIQSPTYTLSQLWVNGSYWQNKNQQTMVLDQYGNVTGEVDQDWYNNAWRTDVQSRHHYAYDSANRIATNEYQMINVSTWYTVNIDSFAYDAAGNKVHDLHYNLSSGVNPNYNKQYSGWDSYNMVTSEVQIEVQGTSTISHDSTHYYYHTGQAILPNGVLTLASDQGISIYPVPARGVMHIAYSGDTPLTSAEITDMTGRTLLSQKINAPVSQIDISAIPAGIYQVATVDARGTKAIRRILIQ